MRSEGYYSRTTGYEAAHERYQQLQCYKGKKIKCGDFAETTAFERYGVKTIEKALPRPDLARSAHRGRIKFLRVYVFKSSAALKPLTITQLACELSMRGRY